MSLTKNEERKLSKLTEAEAKNIQALLDFIDCVKLADDGKKDMPELHAGDKVVFPGSAIEGAPDMKAYIGKIFDNGTILFYSTGLFAGSWNEIFEERNIQEVLTLEENGYVKCLDSCTKDIILALSYIESRLKTQLMWIPKFADLENPIAKYALEEAATNMNEFKAACRLAWLGTPDDSCFAYSVDSGGNVNNYYDRSGSGVVAPAFTIKKSDIKWLVKSDRIEVVEVSNEYED